MPKLRDDQKGVFKDYLLDRDQRWPNLHRSGLDPTRAWGRACLGMSSNLTQDDP